jgi:hypothetical protein
MMLAASGEFGRPTSRLPAFPDRIKYCDAFAKTQRFDLLADTKRRLEIDPYAGQTRAL